MAYFLDPELDALTTGNARKIVKSFSRSAEQPRRANKFGKKCHGCGEWVNAGAGLLAQAQGAWVVYCGRQSCRNM